MDTTFLNIKEVAARLGVSEKTIYRMLTENQIPFAVKIGGQWRFKADEIEAWINSQKNTDPGRGRVDYKITLHTALLNGTILYRLHGENRDQIIDELLAALPYSSAFDSRAIKVAIFARESVVSSSMKGIAFLSTGTDKPVFLEKTMVLLAHLEEPMDFRAIDRTATEAIVLLLPANPTEQALVDARLRRLAMDDDFVSAIKRQLTRKELLDFVSTREKEIFRDQP